MFSQAPICSRDQACVRQTSRAPQIIGAVALTCGEAAALTASRTRSRGQLLERGLRIGARSRPTEPTSSNSAKRYGLRIRRRIWERVGISMTERTCKPLRLWRRRGVVEQRVQVRRSPASRQPPRLLGQMPETPSVVPRPATGERSRHVAADPCEQAAAILNCHALTCRCDPRRTL